MRFSLYISVYCDFQVLSQNFEKRLLASLCLSVCLSVRPHGTTRFPLEES